MNPLGPQRPGMAELCDADTPAAIRIDELEYLFRIQLRRICHAC